MPIRRPFSCDDLYLHQKITDVACSPDGTRALCTVQTVDRGSDNYTSCIWIFPLDREQSGSQLTRGPGQDSSPTWSPSGDQIAFISTRSGGAPQIYLISPRGGEARQLSNLPKGASMVQWAPDGQSLLACAAVETDAANTKCEVEVVTRLPYKEDGIGFILGRHIHLFRIDVETGEHRQLTHGDFDVLAFQASPAGDQIAYVRTREGRFAHRNDLWICDASGVDSSQLTSEQSMVMEPQWSPNGADIVFTGSVREGDAQSTFWRVNVLNGEVEEIADASVEIASGTSWFWDCGGKDIVFVRAMGGQHTPARLSFPEGGVTTLAPRERQLSAFAWTGSKLIYCIEHPSMPSNLWMSGPEGQDERCISDFNRWWRHRDQIQAEIRTFDVPDGRGGTEEISGWIIRRKDLQLPAPLLNDVHGGPAAYALLDYDTNVFWQVLCSEGWCVLALNAVGSASYGAEFCNRLGGHWGEYDLPQHLAAIEQLQREGVCDDRLAISGKSYGGYLSSWAIGHTDMFKAAVVMAPVGNIETHYGTSDGGYYADPLYMGTQPRFDRKLARSLSPLQYVEQSKTPTMFMQGKEDERCPKCQSEEMYVSLMRAGDTPATLVLYPGETHGFLGEGAPACRLDAAQRIVRWITEHAIDRAGAKSENAEKADQAAELSEVEDA